ncbi:MAG: hypothetical protein QM791_16890 [Ferruginibacter sp.]
MLLLGIVVSATGIQTAGAQAAKKKAPAKTSKAASLKPGQIFALSRATKNEILIRWAPADFSTWNEANRNGYAIEKYIVQRGGKVLPKIELSQPRMIIKPRPLEAWDSIANNNDYAAVIAQAMYGEDFEVTMKNQGTIATMINETEKTKQRFAMAMYAADHSYAAAVFAGVGWTDKNVKPGEKYFYRIYTLVPKTVQSTDTATLFTGLADFKPLPRPSELFCQFGDHSVTLKWDFDSYKEFYTSYIVERSEDGGKNFKPVSDMPVTDLTEKKADLPDPGMLFIDSLTDNETIYTYRIAGVSLFGDTGPYSNAVSGKGKIFLPLTPGITSVSQNEAGKYSLNWYMEDSLNHLIKEFRINLSDKVDGKYKTIRTGLSPQIRTAAVDSLYSSNYFTVTAVSKGGEEKTSFPYLLQPEDSVAPATPVLFTGTIDSTGVVLLRWNANTEKDLAGYRIFKANVKGHELIPLFDTLWHKNEIRDTVNIKNLNKKLYYTVNAVDHRYNQSPNAPLLEIKKPDVIPPSQPVFSNYEVSDDGVKIEWINSPDDDIMQHDLYRKKKGGPDKWELVKSFPGSSVKEVIEKELLQGATYSYTLVAVDSARLESEPAIPLVITVSEKRVKKAIQKLMLETDRDNRKINVSWQLVPGIKNIKKIELYRGADKEKMELYKLLDKTIESFTDKELLVNTIYKYGIRAVYVNGMYSDFITETINY